ncbi:MAG: type II toxin-antitoxin system prevent-host-death family antitoxin [Gammaproteobacteria bacterium]|nr:type II toxin-antitoxin system prevent-host-death family antitoxin [Gammaproteobacteria bacterium]
MTAKHAKPNRTWTVAEAKARLSEILRLTEEEGPQRIGTRRSFVIVPAAEWDAKTPSRKPLGQWLVENMPRGIELEFPDRNSNRKIPFIDEEEA